MNGRVRTLRFDSVPNTKTLTSPEGATWIAKFTPTNLISEVRLGADLPAAFTYDGSGKLITTSQGGKNELTRSYNTAGLVSSVIDGLGRTTSYQYDADNRLTKTILPDLREIAYAYDANGNMASITPPSRPAHSFLRNAMELVEQYLPPGLPGLSTPETTYSYDLDKRLTKIVRPDGQEMNYSYSSASGLLAAVSAGASSSRIYTYKSGTPLVETAKATDGPNSIKNVYTYYGTNVASIEQRRGSDDYRYGKVSFGFDADHRRIFRTVEGHDASSGSTINYTLNKDDKPTQIGAMSLSYSYPSGRLSGTVLDNISDAYTYDTLGNLKTYTASITANGGTDQVLYRYELVRDAMSRIVGKTETIQGITTTYEYGFDIAGRLTSVKVNGFEIGAFVYDENGNRIGGTLNGSPLTAVFDPQDRIISFNGRIFSHNANGDLTAVSGSEGGSSFSYNSYGEMTGFIKKGTAHNLTYDANRSLVGMLKDGHEERHFLYESPLRIAAEVDAGGNISKEYVYGLSLNSPDYLIAAGSRHRIIKDHLGSPRLVVSSLAGSVVQRMDYDVFGKAIRDTNTCFQAFGFAGGVVQEGTSFVKFGARYYSPELGRWISKDPILFDGEDTNLFGYVFNDPVNALDPSGLYMFRQAWQRPGAVGRKGSKIVPDDGAISNIIESYVPAGYAFGVNHDAFVDWATAKGAPDWLINIPSMTFAYQLTLQEEILRSIGFLPQPQPKENCSDSEP